jgi:hypothetical protein
VRHLDTARWRSVRIGPATQGTEIRTYCGIWLPAWTDGPDGEENRARWAIYGGGVATCPACLALLEGEE